MSDDPARNSSELLDSSRAGDPIALEDLLTRHLPDLQVFVRIRMTPALRAQESQSDLVQSVCREVLAKPDRFEFAGEVEFKNWLFGAVLQKVRDHERYWRAERRNPERMAADSVGRLAAAHSSGSPSQELITAEEIQQLEEAYDGLTEEQREVLTLHRWVGLSHRQIGEKLGKSEGAVRMIQLRAVARLSSLLERTSG